MQMLDVVLALRSFWLVFERMQLSTGHEHGLARVLVVVRERIVAVSVVEADEDESDGASDSLGVRNPSQVGCLVLTYKTKRV